MRFYVVTVLPEIFGSFLTTGLVGKGIAKGLLGLETITPRDFTTDKHRTVDDTPYGGGSGMVMMPQPVVHAMEDAEARERPRSGARPLRVLLSAQGRRFDQAMARELSSQPAITLVCGRYEGIDERAVARVDREISLGDYVLMGGEVGAMVLVEAVSRLIPGVLGNPSSIVEESHATGLLEGPQYTRPAEFRGDRVPEVLVSGHHAVVAKWRRREALRRTLERRPDLLETAPLDAHDRKVLAELEREREAARLAAQEAHAAQSAAKGAAEPEAS
ncbi:MAG: tRNA (guanosine(37)-N1)-methyltransferase TrmD [Sandaracinaceae bacterium]|nr:tRNA (guanosine(37)-N1)-methyltransferase TrmD [Sandaracinaceae bacterium]